MAAPPDFVTDHYTAQASIAAAAELAAADMWANVDPGNISRSWAAQLPRVVAVTTGGQLAAATLAEPYLQAASAYADVDELTPAVAARAFAGTASDGRTLLGLLYQPANASLLAIRHGADTRTALATGLASLRMMVSTQVTDMGRSAVQAGTAGRKSLGGQVRIALGRACSRCVVLAGKWYRWNAGFDRHPLCKCVGLPARSAADAGIKQDPKQVYNAMSPAERSRAGWSKADQKAIAEGADIAQVTNIHRKGNLYVADGRQYTREGARARGRRGDKTPRPTPNQIYRDAAGDRDKAIRLLREHGYLYGP